MVFVYMDKNAFYNEKIYVILSICMFLIKR